MEEIVIRSSLLECNTEVCIMTYLWWQSDIIFRVKILSLNYFWYCSAMAERYHFQKQNWYCSATADQFHFVKTNWYCSATAELYYFQQKKLILLGHGRAISFWKNKIDIARPRQAISKIILISNFHSKNDTTRPLYHYLSKGRWFLWISDYFKFSTTPLTM